uniref:Triosephosphate isomerase n=1 Tax=Glossina austeni TaxID=7395 RepID=A0A1A9UKB0_GLOAU
MDDCYSREKITNTLYGHIPELIINGKLESSLNLEINSKNSHIMLCGNPNMVRDTYECLNKKYFMVKNYQKSPGHITTAQNVDIHISGSFTGEISAYMLQEFGTKYVIIGHAERRRFHNEDQKIITKKLLILKQYNLKPILCIGEIYQNYRNKEIKNVCIKQIGPILKVLGIESFKEVIIAYEPVWAIGTGKTPPVEHIQNVHLHIRSYLSKYDSNISKNIILQYGGSVNSKNALNILLQPDVDGILLGKASVHLEEFLSIVRIANNL